MDMLAFQIVPISLGSGGDPQRHPRTGRLRILLSDTRGDDRRSDGCSGPRTTCAAAPNGWRRSVISCGSGGSAGDRRLAAIHPDQRSRVPGRRRNGLDISRPFGSRHCRRLGAVRHVARAQVVRSLAYSTIVRSAWLSVMGRLRRRTPPLGARRTACRASPRALETTYPDADKDRGVAVTGAARRCRPKDAAICFL